MYGEPTQRKIAWYRSPVERETLAALNQRSDWQGAAANPGPPGAARADRRRRLVSPPDGCPGRCCCCSSSSTAPSGPFCSTPSTSSATRSVFKTKALNTIFLQIVSFLSWNNPVLFWTSHQEHHKYTLHPPDDLEVVLPVKLTCAAFFKSAWSTRGTSTASLKGFIRLSLGRLEGEWENAPVPRLGRRAAAQPVQLGAHPPARARADRRRLARTSACGMLPVVITLAPFYGGGLQYLCNNTQHAGLQDKVPDYRLCTRTILLNPFVRFLYWQMNYHIEHHMYAAVPCYNLRKLHEQIKADLPHCPKGLGQAWKEIIAILERQKLDPSYQYVAELPGA